MEIWDKLVLFALHQLSTNSRYNWFTLQPVVSHVVACVNRRYAEVDNNCNTTGKVSSSLNKLVVPGILRRMRRPLAAAGIM